MSPSSSLPTVERTGTVRVRPLLGAFTIVLLLVLLAWPALVWLWKEWWSNDVYAHGPLVPLVSAFFVWRQVKKGLTFRRDPTEGEKSRWNHASLLPLVTVVCSLGAVLWATAIAAHYLVALALLPLIVGLLWYLGITALRRFAFPVGYLVYAVPLPVVDWLVTPLQQFAVRWSTGLAQLLGVPATHEGSRIILTTCDLTVGAPCSGLYSLIALLALTTVMAYVLEGRPWARCVVVPTAIPVALLVNVMRVLALLLVAERWGAQVALGLWHDWSGLVFFGLALASLIVVSGWLGCRELRADI